MHVLRQLHQALRPAGVLLDIHPEPQHPRVEIVRGNHSTPVGSLDWTQDIRDIREARERLVSVQRAGLFRVEGRRLFTFRIYHDDVDAWLAFREEHDSTNVVPPDVLRAARREMRAPGATLAVLERARATALRHVPS